MSKAYSRFLTALFCAFLADLLVWHLLLPDRERSQTENRLLAQWPEFSWTALRDGSFTEAVEEYFADQFPLRDQWTGMKARAEQLLGKTEFHGVYLCGGTLISKVEPPEEDRVRSNLAYIQRFAERVQAPVVLGFIPSAAEIWRDKLPPGAESWDQTLLLAAAEETGLRTADLYNTLADHSGEDIFYRTDHHWTTLGAFYGANALLEELGHKSMDPNGFTRSMASDSFQGTLYSQSGIHWLEPDTIEFWVEPDSWWSVTSWKDGKPQAAPLYDLSYLDTKDKYSAFLGGNQPLCAIRNKTGAGKLLLIRDSYSDALAPFLATRFEEVHLMDLRYYRASAAKYVEENGIDQVAVVYSIPNFITDRNLALLGQ